MEPLTLTEVRMLARAVVAAGDSFCCRRLLQRFEREELEFRDVLVRLAALQPRQTWTHYVEAWRNVPCEGAIDPETPR